MILATILVVLPMVNAQEEPRFIAQQSVILDFKDQCFNNGTFCSSVSLCNATIYNPNTTVLVNNQPMTNQVSFHNFTLTAVETRALGSYQATVICKDGSVEGADTFFFEITPTGRVFSQAQGLTSFAILGAVLALAFLFMILGFKLGNNQKTLPLALFFVVFALLLGVYSLQLGFVYSNDIIQYESLTPVQSGVYIAILFSLIGIAIISTALMMIAFLRDFFTQRSLKSFGADFDPISRTYA